MMTSRLITIVVVPALCLSLFACGKQKESKVAYGNKNQILYVNNGDEPEDLDPHITTGTPESRLMFALFEGLTRKNAATLEPIPGVAESWEISEDGKTYTFTIRDNARWSNGDPLTANDFVYSWRRILSPAFGSRYSYMLYHIKNAEQYHSAKITDFNQVGVKSPTPNTLVVELNNPAPFFLQLLDHHSYYPVHQATIEKFGDIDTYGTQWTRMGNFVGNGPFALAAWEINKIVSVKRNPMYWDADAVKLNEIHFSPVVNLTTIERMFRSNQIHASLGTYIAIEKISWYKENQPEKIHITPGYATYYYHYNVTRKPFDDVRVRRALAMAIDRQKIIDKVTKGGQLPAYAFTPSDPNGYSPKAALEFNVEKARQLLAEAGYPNGEGFPSFELMYNTLENHRKIATAIQQMWKQNLNINTTLYNLEWKVYLKARENLEHDVVRAGWLADFVDPSNFMDLMLSYSGNNHSAWKNKQYDELVETAMTMKSEQDRYALYQQAEQILIDDMPIIPIYFYSHIHLVQPSLQGWHDNIMSFFDFKNMSLTITE